MFKAKTCDAIQLVHGDITALHVDAIVNAANDTLLGGGGVDGAIHSVSGPELLEECRALNGCKTGEAKLTKGYNLPAQFVIHTVGPIWAGGDKGEANLLKSCYHNCLKIAAENKFNSIAFPAISTGVYGYPFEEAAKIALEEIRSFCETNDYPRNVTLVFFREEKLAEFKRLLR